MRSIAVDRDASKNPNAGMDSDMNDWGSTSTSTSPPSNKNTASPSTKNSASTSTFDNSFNIAAWGDSLSAASGRGKEKKVVVPEKVAVDADEGFERYVLYSLNIEYSLIPTMSAGFLSRRHLSSFHSIMLKFLTGSDRGIETIS